MGKGGRGKGRKIRKRLFTAAQCVQRYTRGWLTRRGTVAEAPRTTRPQQQRGESNKQAISSTLQTHPGAPSADSRVELLAKLEGHSVRDESVCVRIEAGSRLYSGNDDTEDESASSSPTGKDPLGVQETNIMADVASLFAKAQKKKKKKKKKARQAAAAKSEIAALASSPPNSMKRPLSPLSPSAVATTAAPASPKAVQYKSMFGFDQLDHHDRRVGSLVTDVAAAVDQPAFASSEGDCTGLSESFSAEVLGDILARAVAVTQAPHSPLVAERWNNVPLVLEAPEAGGEKIWSQPQISPLSAAIQADKAKIVAEKCDEYSQTSDLPLASTPPAPSTSVFYSHLQEAKRMREAEFISQEDYDGLKIVILDAMMKRVRDSDDVSSSGSGSSLDPELEAWFASIRIKVTPELVAGLEALGLAYVSELSELEAADLFALFPKKLERKRVSRVVEGGTLTTGGAVGAGASKTGAAGLSDDELSKKLQARWDARIYKDWATSDSIRAELNDLGIIINDRTQSWKCHVSGRAGSTKPTDLMNATAASTTTVESLLITRNLFPAVI